MEVVEVVAVVEVVEFVDWAMDPKVIRVGSRMRERRGIFIVDGIRCGLINGTRMTRIYTDLRR